MSNDVRLAIVEEAVKDLKSDAKDANKEQMVIINNALEMRVNQDHLEQRLVKHSARHENNYKELVVKFEEQKKDQDIKFEEQKKDQAGFKTDVLGILNKIAGRDSILKVLFGGVVGTVVGAVAIAIILKAMGV